MYAYYICCNYTQLAKSQVAEYNKDFIEKLLVKTRVLLLYPSKGSHFFSQLSSLLHIAISDSIAGFFHLFIYPLCSGILILFYFYFAPYSYVQQNMPVVVPLSGNYYSFQVLVLVLVLEYFNFLLLHTYTPLQFR